MSGNVMFSLACRQVVNEHGKNTLIPVRALDENGNVKPLQLVIIKKKRFFFFRRKFSYYPTKFQLTDVQLKDVECKSPLPETQEVLSRNFKKLYKWSMKGKFAFRLFKHISDNHLKGSGTCELELGELTKIEVSQEKLMQELGKRKLNMDHDFITQVRENEHLFLGLVTGVVRLTGNGHVSRDINFDAKADATTQLSSSATVKATANVAKKTDGTYELHTNTALAYNVVHLRINVQDGSMTMITIDNKCGSFSDPNIRSGQYNSDLDTCYPEETFKAILDLVKEDREKLTSLILEMMSVPRDIQIFKNLVKKPESKQTKLENVQELEKELLTEKQSWLDLLNLAGITVQASGELSVPEKKTPLLLCFVKLFDALSELQDEELDLIRQCAPQTVPALFRTFGKCLDQPNVTENVTDYETIKKDDKAIDLLKQLGYSVSEQEIGPPTGCLLTIDEVYVVMFALWGQNEN